MLKPVDKQRVAEEVAEQLRSSILSGRYPVGSKLPPERELSKQLRVNRASLREALKKLEHLGLVRIRQGDGTRVQDFMATAGIELVQHLPPLAAAHPELIHDLLEFHRLFGRELGRLAAVRAEPADLDRLRDLAARADDAATVTELFDLDFAFYSELARISRNQIVVLLVNTVREGIRGFMPVLADLSGPVDVVRRHRELVAAIESPGSAEALAD
jgi:GntR family transcriptional repressor for pyruvate dehydrogenase complex